LIRTGTFRFYFDLPSAVWDRVDAGLTYAVPIPIVLFARAIFPGWRRFWTTGALGLTGVALYGIASDAILDRSESAIVANNVIAIAFFAGVLVWIFRPGLTPSRELLTARVGASAVSVTAVADNLRGIGALAFPGPTWSHSASRSSSGASGRSPCDARSTTPGVSSSSIGS
jgi:hypothetical protein